MPTASSRALIEGFTTQDFAVFELDGFAERMEAIKTLVRPKLTRIGEVMAPELSELLGVPMYAHVARHARRSVNPPKDTWVAFSASARGYKAHPHFQVGLWADHLFIQFALIYESPDRPRFARNVRANLDQVHRALPAHFRWSLDHARPEGTPEGEMDATRFDLFLGKIEKLKNAEVLCGEDLPAGDARVADGNRLLAEIRETFRTLLPLYRLATA